MTFEQFVNEIWEDHGNYSIHERKSPNNYYSSKNYDALYTDEDLKKADYTELYLYDETYVGGMSGGNCWDDTTPTYSSSGNPQDCELKILDSILEKYYPNLSFLQYKNLYNNLVENNTRTQSEYYGNTSEYVTKSLRLKDLYDYMIEKGWLTE